MPKKPVGTKEQLLAENEDLRERLNKAEEILRAIRSDEVDALVVPGLGGDQVFTVKGAEHSYRILIEQMSEGALTMTKDGVILYANRRFAEMLKMPLEKVIGSTIHTWIAPDSQQILKSLLRKNGGEKRREQLELSASDRTLVPVHLSVSSLLIKGMPNSFCMVATDLTEQKRSDSIAASEKLARELLSATEQSRLALLGVIEDQKRTEEALHESESIFRGFLEQSEDAIMLTNEQGVVVRWSRGAEKLTGYSRAETIGKPLWDIQFWSMLDEFKSTEHYERLKASMRAGLATGEENSLNHLIEIAIQRPDGTRLITQTLAFPIQTHKGFMFGTIIRDITELKEAEETLRASAARYQGLFEESPISLWEADYSGVKQRLDNLRTEGITNFQEYFTSHPEAVTECAALVKILDVNKATLSLFGANRKEEMLKSLAELFEGEPSQEYLDELITIATGKTRFDWEGINKTLDGRLINIKMSWSVAPGYENSLSKVIISLVDVTERKDADAALSKSEKDYRTLFENMPIGLYRTAANGYILDANHAMAKMFGYKDGKTLLGANMADLFLDPASDRKFKNEIKKNNIVSNFEAEFKRLDGTVFWTEDHIRLIHDAEGKPLFYEGSLIDITERKQSEAALKLQSAALNAAANSIMISDREGIIEWVNQAFTTLTGYTSEETIGRNLRDLVKSGKQDQRFYKRLWDTILAGRIWHGEIINRRKDGSFYFEEQTITGLKNADGKIGHFISIKQNITERKRSDERIQRQLEHLASLRDIDQVVISSFELQSSLTMILNQVTRELGVDAADVLLLNNNNLFLEYIAGVGFRTKAAEKTTVRLGQNYAGRAALERQLIQIPDLKDQPDDIFLRSDWAGEDFTCYFGVPLVAKGIIQGVLEVYHRAPLKPDEEWFDFLKTLAGQAALAIDNTNLFESLQRSNIELILAYDATIEGWSRAMDLRDKETEGHTQRVTEMTMKLAALFGIKDEELVNIRRGALLHDIGKMGVPDSILLKPTTLTDEEWAIMRKHPTLAFEMLAPIQYLKGATDIPYCHHEKWNGTGYPRGLVGEQIPLGARIFAVVDVWDALTSDRPYRKAWSKNKAIKYLRSQSGMHLDPQIMKVCLESGIFV